MIMIIMSVTSVVAIVTAFYSLLWGWVILAISSAFVCLVFLSTKQYEWPQIPELSDEANRMLQRFGHFYNWPRAGNSFCSAASVLGLAGLALAIIGLFWGFWLGLGIGVIYYYFMSWVARGFNPTQFLVDPIDKMAHAEVLAWFAFLDATSQGHTDQQVGVTRGGIVLEEGNKNADLDTNTLLATIASTSDREEVTRELTALGLWHKEVANDPAAAVRCYREAAKAGVADAQYRLGVCYAKGDGVKQDSSKAFAWFSKAAEQGDPVAQYTVGSHYRIGEGVAKNTCEAVVWLQKAAENGHIDAQYTLGCCYYDGDGVAEDMPLATTWLRRAAEQGHSAAQNELGACYLLGRGVSNDACEAVKWFRRAAEQGNEDSQLNLGDCYYDGEGVDKDRREAVEWYRKAAEQGEREAQHKLGMCCANGEGVSRDPLEAYVWLDICQWDSRLQANLESELSAEQIAEARRRSLEFVCRKSSND